MFPEYDQTGPQVVSGYMLCHYRLKMMPYATTFEQCYIVAMSSESLPASLIVYYSHVHALPINADVPISLHTHTEAANVRTHESSWILEQRESKHFT